MIDINSLQEAVEAFDSRKINPCISCQALLFGGCCGCPRGKLYEKYISEHPLTDDEKNLLKLQSIMNKKLKWIP